MPSPSHVANCIAENEKYAMQMPWNLRILAGIGYRNCQGNFEIAGKFAWEILKCRERLHGNCAWKLCLDAFWHRRPPKVHPILVPILGPPPAAGAAGNFAWKLCLDAFWHHQPPKVRPILVPILGPLPAARPDWERRWKLCIYIFWHHQPPNLPRM